MSAAGFTPIQLYRSTTASAAPTAGNLADGELAINITDGKLYYKDNGGVVQLIASKAGASGDVVGPASATDNAIVRFDGTTGKVVQNSVVTIADSTGDISGVGQLNATTVDATNVEVTNIKAKDGTAAATIADSTGVVSITANPILSGGTANGVLYLNGSKAATSGSALTFDGTNLGVGASPTQRLTVSGNINTLGGSGLLLGDTGLVATANYLILGNQTLTTYLDGGSLYYRTAAGGINSWYNNGSEQMRLTSTGLGIGTSSPGVRLDVVGVMRSTFNSSSNGGPGSHGLELRQSTTSTKALIAGYSTSGNQTGAYIQAVDFGTAYEDLVLQPQGGNLGLGVTPSAWSAGNRSFQFGSRGVLNCDVNGVTYYGNNLYYDGSNFKYIESGYANIITQEAGAHKWFTAPSGTAGNAISFTQALTLDANRNLLLNGTTAGASSIGTFAIFNGTAPTGSVTNGCILYAEDVSSSSELKVRDEAGNVTTLSPHNFELIPEGPSEDMAWSYYSERDGKRINVDMLKAIRLLEKISGEQLVYKS